MFPQSENRFDQQLAAWFFRRGGAWTGTASELLASLGNRCQTNNTSGPQSPRELYDHLRIHRQMLESLGVDALVLPGAPRMVVLRSRQNEERFSKISSPAQDIDSLADLLSNPPSLASSQRQSAALPNNDGQPALHGCDGNLATDQSERMQVSCQHAARHELGGRVFENTGEALVAIGEMRQRIREERLGLESALDVVINRAKEITRSCGITVGFLPQQKSDQPVRTVGSSSIAGLDFDASLFQSSLRAGEVVALHDAQEHPLLGAECQRAGIASLIMVPIFRDREVAGAMQFLFRERLDCSPGDVMDLGLVAGVISESLGSSPQIGMTQPEGRGRITDKESGDGIGRRPAVWLRKQSGRDEDMAPLVRDANDATTIPGEPSSPEAAVLHSLASSRLSAAPSLLWRALKRAWTAPSRET